MHHEQSQDNKKSTPTSDIAPGAPIWYRSASGVHNNQDKGHGYSAHDPVPLTTGSSQRGSALTRFGKFGFIKQEATRTFDHGNVYDITIVREEGSQGTWTIKIKSGDKDTGVMGNLHSGVEHGYSVCRVDLDLFTLNKDLPGFELDQPTGNLLLTFQPGEVKKVIKAVAPYRTTVKTLEPDVLRQAVTYHVAEWIPYHWAKYRVREDRPMAWRSFGEPRHVGRVWWFCGGYWNRSITFPTFGTANGDPSINPVAWRAWEAERLSIDHNRHTTQDRWTWYNVLTLPMPRTWIEELQGNEIYIDNYDRNYKYRQQNNTCRDRHVPYRKDDITKPDQKTDGWVTRYDHNNKMEVVVGQTRLTSMYMRRANRMQRRSRFINSWCYYRPRYNVNNWHLFFTPFEQDQQFHFISNDRRITHRHTPEYPGATTHGVVYRPIVNASGEEQWINSLADQIGQPEIILTGHITYPRQQYATTYSTWSTLGEFLQDDHRNSPWNVAVAHKNADTLRNNNKRVSKQNPSWTTIAHPGLQGPYWYGEREYHAARRANGTDRSSGLRSRDQVPVAHALHGEWDWKTHIPGWYNMQTGYGLTDDVTDTNFTWSHIRRFKNSKNDLKHFDSTGAIAGRAPGELKYRQIPMNHTGWKREDFPGDPWFKYFKQNLNTFYPNNPAATNADGSDRVVEYYAWVYYSRGTTAGYDFVKGTHPLTPANMHDNDTRINWSDGIPAKWQSWYESTRYRPGVDNANDKHWALERPETLESRMPKVNIRSWTSQPVDKIFNYGDPTTGVGDLAQVMFNHTGMDRDKFLTGQSSAPGSSGVIKNNTYGFHAQQLIDQLNSRSCTEYFVMKYEDPSNVKDYYDGLGKNFQLQHPNQTLLEYSNRYYNRDGNVRWCANCEYTIDDIQYNYNRFNNGGTDNRGFTNPVDWTDLWLTHDPLCAGKLDQLDAKNVDNGFMGYRWDNTTYDTTNGIESATKGLGSPGHGEQGTSRILYDFRDLVHPLSSYELNKKNLRGYYMSCVDHVDRQINLTIDYSSEDDLYALGQTTCSINLVHTPEYDPMLHEKYDRNIKGDSQIRPGPTFSTNQSWDDIPNNRSVTERLFTIDGSLPSNPVSFLGLSAGVYAGGDPENPVEDPPLAPGLLRINPITSRVVNTIEDSSTRDWNSEPLHVVKQFSNQGTGTLILTLPYTLGEEYGYTKTDGTTTGDDASLWSWEYHDTSSPETSYTFPSRPPKNRPGPAGLYNTVSLSADEKIAIRYTLKGRSSFWSRYEDGKPTCEELYTESAGYEYEIPADAEEPAEIDQPEPAPLPVMVVPPVNSVLRENLKIATDDSGQERVTHTKCPAKYNTVNHDIVVTNTDGSETLRQQTFVTKYLG